MRLTHIIINEPISLNIRGYFLFSVCTTMFRNIGKEGNEWDRVIFQKNYWRDGNINLAIYGLENQTVVDGQMPVRIFGYEGANYRSQYGNEYISPVVTIVLYFGTSKRWDKPIELKDIMSIPDELQPFVNNCRANVIDIAWLPDEQIEQFCSDFGIVARFFSSKRKNPTYVSDDKRFFTHTDAVLKFLHVMTGDSEYEKLLNNSHFKKEGASMCSVAQSLKAMGREEERLSAILRMIEKDFDKEVILSLGYSETEYEQAERNLYWMHGDKEDI